MLVTQSVFTEVTLQPRHGPYLEPNDRYTGARDLAQGLRLQPLLYTAI